MTEQRSGGWGAIHPAARGPAKRKWARRPAGEGSCGGCLARLDFSRIRVAATESRGAWAGGEGEKNGGEDGAEGSGEDLCSTKNSSG